MTKEELQNKKTLLCTYKKQLERFDPSNFIYNEKIGILTKEIKKLENEINYELGRDKNNEENK